VPAGDVVRAATCVLVLGLSGCVARGPYLPQVLRETEPRSVELETTPFFPQREYQCGPAALATVLTASGASVEPDELVGEVYLPGRQGSLQPEIVAAARSRGRLAYILPPEPAALVQQIAAGTPVLVLQKTGAGPWPGWHYAVLVGYDADEDNFVLRSGTEERLELSAALFLATWDRAGRWGIVTLPPGTLPAHADFARYMEAAASLEATGRMGDARLAYETAALHWPREPLPLLGLANVDHARGDLGGAERSLHAASELAPHDAVVRNNRAAVLLQLGCPASAQREIEAARALAADGPMAAAIAETAAGIAAAHGPDGPGCLGP
jgi:hypothetical protein